MLFFFFLFSACGGGKQPVTLVDNDGDGYQNDVDCDDENSGVFPEAIEICDEIDNDCDGLIDDQDDDVQAQEYWTDLDGDGFGGDNAVKRCEATENLVWQDGDCDDQDPNQNPNAAEICNEADDNCNGEIDENATDAPAFYTDADGDGYGSSNHITYECTQPEGYVGQAGDCEDDDAAIHPEAIEICDDLDNDCDDLVDDEDPDLSLENPIPYHADGDGDGFGDPDSFVYGCQPPEGYVEDGSDCDDGDGYVHPDITQDRCNGKDDDCDGQVDEDVKVGWELVSIDTQNNQVWDIDPLTAESEILSSISNTSIRINSMDVSEANLSVVHDHLNNKLWLMNACTGEVTDIGSTQSGNTCGIAFGPGGKLYGLDSTNNRLVEYNTQTGVGTAIGPLGAGIASCGLAYDCANDRLIGANSTTDEIFTIDPQTGNAYDFVSTAVPFQSVGLEFNPTTGMLWAATGNELYEVDPVSGSTNFVGSLSGQVDDLALHPSCPQ